VKPVNVDFRLVTATNRDLQQMMSRGEFRTELYYRLSTMSIAIPPLKARTEDIELLVRHFLKTLGHSHLQINQEAMEALIAYNWPGNVRELKNVIERAVSLTDDNVIGLEQLTTDVLQMGCGGEDLYGDSDNFLVDEMARFEKSVLERALRLNKGNMSKTSKKLGISRSTLYEKCGRYRLLKPSPNS
jgi:transcriptional regulator with PAS, ATPase and Fis domain